MPWPPTWAEWASSRATTPRILHNNALINLHSLHAAVLNGVSRYFSRSSACVYPEYRQLDEDIRSAPGRRCLPRGTPRMPTAGRSSSRSCSVDTIRADHEIETRVLRFHNVYGPLGSV